MNLSSRWNLERVFRLLAFIVSLMFLFHLCPWWCHIHGCLLTSTFKHICIYTYGWWFVGRVAAPLSSLLIPNFNFIQKLFSALSLAPSTTFAIFCWRMSISEKFKVLQQLNSFEFRPERSAPPNCAPRKSWKSRKTKKTEIRHWDELPIDWSWSCSCSCS